MIVDVVFQELHQRLLADARQELTTDATTGRALRHAHPAGGACILPPGNRPTKKLSN